MVEAASDKIDVFIQVKAFLTASHAKIHIKVSTILDSISNPLCEKLSLHYVQEKACVIQRHAYGWNNKMWLRIL